MSMSAARIRSMSNRSRFAEEAAFPGLRSERSTFPYNQKCDWRAAARDRGCVVSNLLFSVHEPRRSS